MRIVLGLAALAMAAPAAAQTPAPAPPATNSSTTLPEVVVTAPEITNPDWLRRPNGEDLGRVYPTRAIEQELEGHVRLRCQVSSNGYLTRCRVDSETPTGQGFGAAALSMQSMFQMRPRTVNGQAVTGATVVIPMNFTTRGGTGTRTGARDQPPTRTRDRALNRNTTAVVYRPVWTEAPTREQVIAAAPASPGTATIRCRVAADGSLSNCETVLDYPEGMGLGDAAERLGPLFRLAPPPGLSGASTVDVDIPFDLRRDPPEYVLRPLWRAAPTGGDVQAALEPIAAAAANHTARAQADCRIAAGGVLTDCRITEADPVAAGPAVLSLVPRFSISPWTDDGYATVGARVRLPLRYVAD